MITFKEAKISSSKMREHNDCAVKALAIAGNKSYEEVHSLFKSLGRKNRRGTSQFIIHKAAKQVNPNFVFKNIRKPNGSFYTARSIREAFPKGRYMILYRGHIAAMVDGTIEDWSEGRCHRVLGIFEM